MREHAAYYKQFIDVHPGGGIRRNPKRKNAGSYSSPANFTPPSDAEIDKVFEGHLQSMARGGTYGDNMEIVAFSSAFGVDVKIYQRDFAFMISGAGEPSDDAERSVAHIAYHVWEHYSSIRNLDGPHTGLPEVKPKVLSPEEELKQKEKLDATPFVQPWQIEALAKALPFLADKPTIKRALEASKGNLDNAWSALVEAEERGSASSAQESSSVERDQDSEDDVHAGPNKKQDRRMSRASKKEKSSKHALSRLQVVNDSQESFDSVSYGDSEASSQPDGGSQQSTNRSSLSSAPTLSANQDKDFASRSASPSKPTIRLKLHPPKPPPELAAQQTASGKTVQNQPGPRLSARDKKDIKKQAQKAARKERQQAAAKGGTDPSAPAHAAAMAASQDGGFKQTPPVETLKTLYI